MVESPNRKPLLRFQTQLKAFFNSQANDYKLSASWEATQVFLFLASFSLLLYVIVFFVCFCVFFDNFSFSFRDGDKSCSTQKSFPYSASRCTQKDLQVQTRKNEGTNIFRSSRAYSMDHRS